MGLLLLLAAISPGWISAQASRDDGIRIGLAVGGISTVGVVVEFFDGNYGIDLTVGTWSFRDISVSAVGKRYVGDHAARPFLGLGLWLAAANPPDGRQGFALVLRAPVGLDWSVTDDHAIGAAVNVSKVLWVRRTDPEDDLPLTGRIVPLPGAYYRWAKR